MGYSKLCRSTVPASSSNYTQGRKGYKVCKFTPHHMAGKLTGEQCARIFQNAGRQASANYCIGNDGEIVGCVDENNRAWTSSNSANDCQAITVEVSNSSIGGDWPVSDAAWKSLVDLAVDVCTRYGFRLEFTGDKNGSLTYHQMFANTSCPGPYLKARMNQLAQEVNARLDGAAKPAEKPVVTVSATKHQIGETVTINGVYTASNSSKKLTPARNSGKITKIVNNAANPYLLDNGNLGWVNDGCIVSAATAAPSQPSAPAKKDIDTIAREVIAGQWGNGQDRFNKLAAAGYDGNAVQNRVNEILSGKTSTASNKKSNDTIANEVIAGVWGNGADRKSRLQAAGYDYNAIQKLVNQKLK